MDECPEKKRSSWLGLLGRAVFLLLLFLSFLFLSPRRTYATTYYVDANGFDGNDKGRDNTFADFQCPAGVAVIGGKVWVSSACGAYKLIRYNTNGRPAFTTNSQITGNGLNASRSIAAVTNSGTTYAWVVNGGGNSISVFNTDGTAYGSPITDASISTPFGIAVVTNGANNYVWVANFAANTISVFNTNGTINTSYSGNGLNGPQGVAVVGSQVWVVNNGNSTISRFNPDGTSAGAVLSGGGLTGLYGIMLNGTKVWVSSYSSKIFVFNTDGTVGGSTITISSNGGDMALVSDVSGTYVWVNLGNDTIQFLNTDGTSATRSCTQASPCITVKYAASFASPGDTISVAAGTYYGADSTGKVGTAGSPITVRAQGTATITCPTPASTQCQRASLFTSSAYNVIDGFTFTGMMGRGDWVPGADFATSTMVPLGDYSTLTNSTIQHTEGSGSGCTTGCTHLDNTFTDIGNTSHYHPIYDTGDGNTVEGNTINGGAGFGVHLYGTGIDHYVIKNNTITGFNNGGIQLQNTNDTANTGTVTGNIIYKNGWGMRVQGGATITNNLFVSNTQNPIVSVFNADTSADSTIYGLGVNAYAAAVVSGKVWVTNSFNNTISRLNTDGTSAGTDISGNGLNTPEGIAVVGSQIWVTNYGNSTISRFNTDGTSAGTALSGNSMNNPAGLAVVGTKVWIANLGSCPTISIFNTDGTSSGTYSETGCPNPDSVAVVGSEVWVANLGNSVTRFDTNGNVLGTITDASFSYPRGIAVIGSEVWVANGNGTAVTRLNTSGTVLGTIADTSAPTGVLSVGGKGWVINGGANGGNFTYGQGIWVTNDLGASTIYNNTFYQNAYNEIKAGSTNSVIKNNLFIGYSTNTTGDTALAAALTGTDANYNDYYNVTTTSNSIGGGANSITSDPLLVNPTAVSFVATNFGLQSSSPAINAGTNTGVTPDLAGVSRPQGAAFDLGAYEYPAPSISSLAQYKSDGTTAIVSGDYTGETTAVFKFSMSSTNASDTLTPQVEVQPLGTTFTNTATKTGSAVAYSGSPVTGTVTVTGLTSGTTYHWQASASNTAGTGAWTAMGGSPDFGIDAAGPSAPSLSLTGYTKDNTKPTLSFKKSTSASGIASYSVSLDPGKNRSFSTSGIPANGNGSADNVWKNDNSVKVEYLHENDSDSSNDEIQVYFKDLEKQDLSEGQHTWTVTAYDTAGNAVSRSADFYIDKTGPSVSDLAISNVSTVATGGSYVLGLTNRMPSFSGLATDAYQGSTITNSDGSKDTFTAVSSGPATITLAIQKQNADKTWSSYLSQDYSLSNIQDTPNDKKSTRFYVTTPFPLVDGTYKVSLTLKDGAGNIYSQPDFYLSFDNSLPGVFQNLVGNHLETKITQENTIPATTSEEKAAVQQTGYAVTVKVVNPQNQPVVGAKVTIHSKVQETTTDKNGVAQFTNVEPGQHKILIAYSGYQGEQNVNLTGEVKEFSFNIQVNPQSAFLNSQVLAVIGVLVLALMALGFLLLKTKRAQAAAWWP